MKQWYYTLSGQQNGPISEPEFVAMFADSRLSPDTPVWTEGLAEWTPACNIEGLISHSNPPPLSSDSVSISSSPCPQVRPWVRYWARTLDALVFSLFGGFIVGLVFPAAVGMSDTLLGIILLFIYNFVEPAMFAAWGTTPGKALLRITLRNKDGSKLSYADALNRVFKVWIRGEGLGIPLVALFTQVNAYKKLTNNGITSWDQDASILVKHQTIGAWRVVVCIAIFIVFFLFIGAASA